MGVLASSTFLDFVGYQLATPQDFATLASATGLDQAQQLQIATQVLGNRFGSPGHPAAVSLSSQNIIVGLTLDRLNDPTSLLSENWATREAKLADQANIWNLYGSGAKFAQTEQQLATLFNVGSLSSLMPAGYVSTAADRTIWLDLNPAQFQKLFTASLLSVEGTRAWAGNLTLNPGISNVNGVWFEGGARVSNPAVLNSTGVSLPEGPLGIGNSATPNVAINAATPGVSAVVHATPAAIAANYNFPLSASIPTPAIALVEGNVADQAALFQALNAYRTSSLINLPAVTAGQFKIVSGTDPSSPSSGELNLDISVLTGAAPNSTQYLYSFLGGTAFNAYQQIFFDNVNDPGILSSSYFLFAQSTPTSPFQNALQGLFVDGALSNVSVHIAAGDQGSSANLGNGIANYQATTTPTFALAVGGTSLASLYSAAHDQTLQPLLQLVQRNDAATIFQLAAAGLKTLPAHLSPNPPANPTNTLESLFESVWQSLSLSPYEGGLAAAFGANMTGLGGVNTALPVPDYQSAYGLHPTSSSGTGRGVPDVSALSTGDANYVMINPDYVSGTSTDLMTAGGGTSAASPLWAALTAQLDAVFADQHLFTNPATQRLGYYNDLLYMSAAVAPASFNDTMLGNNTNSFYLTQNPTGYFQISKSGYTPAVPTGDGYQAGPGYDLATGLGTPNGMVLARTLTAIAEAQKYSTAPPVATGHGPYTSTSDVSQTLLVQSTYQTPVSISIGGGSELSLGANDQLAWTNRLAGQSVQGTNFDSGLVTLFDGAGKAIPTEIAVQSGAALGVNLGTALLPLYQADYTSNFGFVQYGNATGAVVLARPVAIAQNVQGHDGQEAILRIRQDGKDSLQLEVYRVDDLNGSINGIKPGQSGYAAAAAARDYHTDTGATKIDGPQYGNYKQVTIENVNQGDILALKLNDKTTGNSFWAFTAANQSPGDSGVTHIFNYGLNTFGFEDQAGGGDHDYNDMIVGIDFTSASADHKWLV